VTENELTNLLAGFRSGEIDLESIRSQLRELVIPPTGPTAAAQVDLDRARRCGYPEVVFAPGKTTQAIADVFRMQLTYGQNCLATRVPPAQADELLVEFPEARHNATARTLRISAKRTADENAIHGFVAVITAGTGDLPVAEEAVETSLWMGCRVELIVDVGVAGPHRLPAQKHRFEHADAIVVVAGMEGALPSVVGGHVACPVVAVPTSIGYGASFGGLAALLGMLNSCAANVTVVNIDAGFKAGFVAGLIAQRAAKSAD
jgi:NCAIR mutase (PurE)-related protein